jgi:hypothetical protein
MARFFGEVGYAGESAETPPGSGVWKDVIVEFSYFGDVVRNTRQLQSGEKINDDLTVTNSISIVADPYAFKNILAMRYIRWMGTLWKVAEVDVQSPRLVLRLGGLYNGPTA